jgi:ABC-type polysaccharide/polyol phosphate export permease
MIPERWRWMVWVNPVGRIIGDSRRAMIYGWWPGLRGLALTTAISVGVCALGYVMFGRMQGRLVEHL